MNAVARSFRALVNEHTKATFYTLCQDNWKAVRQNDNASELIAKAIKDNEYTLFMDRLANEGPAGHTSWVDIAKKKKKTQT